MIFKPGSIIETGAAEITIKNQITMGANTVIYKGFHEQEKCSVFLKQYKNPKLRTPWYQPWINYQEELRSRIVNHLDIYTLKIYDFFEGRAQNGKSKKKRYFQCFELLPKPTDLRMYLDGDIDWATRKIWALTFVSLLDKFHSHGIVHTDLKPENLMIREKEKGMSPLILIDFDFSLLADTPPPFPSYTGTPQYFSPEHIRKEAPTEKSDIFTAGIILHELLTGAYPYLGKSPSEDVYLQYDVHQKPLLGSFQNGHDKDILSYMHRMLHPDASQRPSLVEMKQLFFEPKGVSEITALQLEHIGTKKKLSIAHLEVVKRDTIATVAPQEAKVWSPYAQFTCYQRNNAWYLVPNKKSTNRLMCNREIVTDIVKVETGDVICLSSDDGIKRMSIWKIL